MAAARLCPGAHLGVDGVSRCVEQYLRRDKKYRPQLFGACACVRFLILYENRCSRTETARLLDMALAQVSVESYAACVHIDNEVPETCVSVNSILFTRVLVNLIRNAAQAAVSSASSRGFSAA